MQYNTHVAYDINMKRTIQIFYNNKYLTTTMTCKAAYLNTTRYEL